MTAVNKAKQDLLSYKKLKELLHYDSNTGIFTRIKAMRGVRIGDEAGHKKENGYVYIYVNGKSYLAHRLAWFYMTGEWPEQIDHLNHIRDDNRWINFRETTGTENQRNSTLYKNNKSGTTGVYWYEPSEKWATYIKANGKKNHIGYFEGKFEVLCARKSAENKHGYHENHGSAK